MSQPYYNNFLKGFVIVLLMSTFVRVQGQQKLPTPININNAVDYAPSISADGNTLIFQSNRDGKFNLYLSTKDERGQWSNPKPLDKINKFGTHSDLIGGPTISYDGNVLYYFATFKGGKGKEDLWYSVREGNDFGEPINIGSTINSRGYEGFPSISSDGKRIFFMRANKTQDTPGAYCYSIWMSERNVEGEWQEPTKLPAPINVGCEKSPRIMSDNEMLVFASIREGGLSESKFDLYYSRLDNSDNWGEVKAFDYINTKEDELFAAVSACGENLYYVRQTGEIDTTGYGSGFADRDLFSNAMTEESKPKPVMLVKGQLTDEKTGQPLFGELSIVKNGNPNSKGILFTNKGDGSFTLILTQGNNYKVSFTAPGYFVKEVDFDTSDLLDCVTQNQNIALKVWSGNYNIETLSALDNAPIDTEVKVLQSPNNAAVNVERTDKGRYSAIVEGGEVYTVQISGEGLKDTTYTFIPVVDDIERKSFEESVTIGLAPAQLKVRILNKDTREEVQNAILLVVGAKSRKTLHRAILKNDTIMDIDYNETYVILGVAANHFRNRQVLDVAKSGKRGLIEMDLELVELKPGAKLVVNNITFATNSAELSENSFEEINQVIEVLKQNTHIKIEVAAHTDDVGSPESNMRLSDARAKSVLDYMTSKGIDIERLISKGYGESDPAVPNNSAANRALNRRVEFRIPKN